ncbi:hypothetical protein TVAG_224900 [Trichomonas vaginalis G3]|uniref:DUF3447 domain-containing protein n=1 Tax=Trichomonas vaginalis (strain ATCC PRA-98 / G3) TaxID=412133 RepID=A2FSJ9_TRIV3|nr:protein ubiquitination [Trichomonas vaginalis G3]EAX92128.1 hypothetical protein TVAG_224900 [Trichomonas vaginalis G3]KAI5488558.1 protein ubiquitination [Trichomonas vaginalis G3]|eukprot:XP_001305058.1 hypothetical protein [Trichomonas vaginalis G3]
MTSSEQHSHENELNFMGLQPTEVFKYPDQASKTIWSVNSNNLLQVSSEIIDLIKNNKISVQLAFYLIDIFSTIRVKDIETFSEFYQKLSNEFSFIIKPKNDKLSSLLYYKGIKFENFEPKFTQEEILNLYSTDSPLYYISFDKVDDLKNKFPNLDLNHKINDEITPLDCSIKYGSELCFNYLKNMGADYTEKSAKFSVQGGNNNIFMQMIEDDESFDNMINTALNHHNYEIAEYLHSNFRQKPDSFTKSLYFGNYDVVSYLYSNGADFKEYYIFFISVPLNIL